MLKKKVLEALQVVPSPSFKLVEAHGNYVFVFKSVTVHTHVLNLCSKLLSSHLVEKP